MARPDPINIITREQLAAYRDSLSPGMIVSAPIEAVPENESPSGTKKLVKRECVILSIYPHYASVQGLHKEGIFSIKYIDLYTSNPVPQQILNMPWLRAPKEEVVVFEEEQAVDA